MWLRLHPWLGEARLSVVRGGARGLRAWCVLAIAALALALGLRAVGDIAAVVPRLIAQLPLPFALLALVLAYALARGRLIGLDEQLRHGWWAAAPIDPARATRTLVVLALLATALAMLAAAVLLQACGGDAANRTAACWIVDGGLALGALLGLISALRHRRHPGRRLREGRRQPLFGLRWLDDARLPHLSDWQRREGVLRWRRGGHAWMLGAVLAALPGSTALTSGAGVLLIATALAWFSLIVQACAAASVAAERLLIGTPQASQRFARAAWRYPAFAFVCASALASIGAMLLSLSWRAAPVLLTLALVLSLPAVPVLVRGRGRRRMR